MSSDQRFHKREHLRLRSDFARVFARKSTAGNGGLVVYVAGNGLPFSRLGISVSRRIGNAVHRNYVRRRIREAFRMGKADLPVGVDIVCVARSKAKDRSYDIAGALRTLVVRAAGCMDNRTCSTGRTA